MAQNIADLLTVSLHTHTHTYTVVCHVGALSVCLCCFHCSAVVRNIHECSLNAVHLPFPELFEKVEVIRVSWHMYVKLEEVYIEQG